jgi:serine/threonine protein kinase
VVKVVDFDIAKGPEPEGGDEVTRLGYVVGTPEYMSPEQLTGEKLDGRTDIYSLGVTLYRMLTGLLPFRGTDVQKIMLERLTERPVPLAESRPDLAFPEQMQDVLDRALARDRGERYPRAADFARELTALQQTIASSPVGLRGPRDVPETRVAPSGSHSSPKPIAAPAHARRAPAWMFAVGALVVAAAGITAYVKIQDVGDGSGDPSILTNPVGGEDGPPPVLGGDSTDSGGGGSVDPDPVGGGSGGQTDPDDLPQPPTSPRLTAQAAPDVLFAQIDQLVDEAGPFGVTTNTVVARAAADTATTLWATPGITQRDSALAAYVRGMAAIGLRDRESCIRWLDRAYEAGNSGAQSLRQHCNRIDD